MIEIPKPVPRLCLTLAFDLDQSSLKQPRPSQADHDAAVKNAARAVDAVVHFSQHGVTAEDCSAQVVDGRTLSYDNSDAPLSFAAAHNAPFCSDFQVATGKGVRYQFIYDDPNDRLFLRIVTSFGKPEETVDGVLATRIGLTALEFLQGQEVHSTIFPSPAPLKLGLSHAAQFLYQNLIRGLLAIPVAYFLLYLSLFLESCGLKKPPADVTRVHDTVSLLRYHGPSNDAKTAPAAYQVYRASSNQTTSRAAFHAFLQHTAAWTERLGLSGYFYLVNFSPFAAPALTKNIYDITKAETRYRGVFAPAGPPPDASIWAVMNYTLADKMVINNYGNHKHSFTAQPVAFLWDWLDCRSSLCLAACICINGVFLSCFRGLPSSLEALELPEETFGTATKAQANVTWKKTMM